MAYAKTFEKLFLQFCIDGGVTGKVKIKQQYYLKLWKVCHELSAELEVTPMLSVSSVEEHIDPDYVFCHHPINQR